MKNGEKNRYMKKAECSKIKRNGNRTWQIEHETQWWKSRNTEMNLERSHLRHFSIFLGWFFFSVYKKYCIVELRIGNCFHVGIHRAVVVKGCPLIGGCPVIIQKAWQWIIMGNELRRCHTLCMLNISLVDFKKEYAHSQ